MPGPIVHRATHIGSWLRPAELKEARAKFFAGDLKAEELKEVEKKNIAQVVKDQQKVGLKPISNGEYDRE
jgi:methionine synthase II (cobalamin-independent)